MQTRFDLVLNNLPVAQNTKKSFIQCIRHNGIYSTEEIMLRHALNPCFFSEMIGGKVSLEEWECILFFISDELIPQRSFLELKNWEFNLIKSGSSVVDKILLGGFRRGHSYEICGEAGTGKSTLAMQACLSVTNNDGSVVYLAVEQFSIDRLHQISEGCHTSEVDMLDNFVLCRICDWKSLFQRVQQLKSVIDIRKEHGVPIKLIVIDSVGSLQSIEKDSAKVEKASFSNQKELFNTIHKLATYLTQLCAENHIGLLFINQVRSINEITLPALGATWSNFVPTRLLMQKSVCNHRSVRMVYSTCLEQDDGEFLLANKGFIP